MFMFSYLKNEEIYVHYSSISFYNILQCGRIYSFVNGAELFHNFSSAFYSIVWSCNVFLPYILSLVAEKQRQD